MNKPNEFRQCSQHFKQSRMLTDLKKINAPLKLVNTVLQEKLASLEARLDNSLKDQSQTVPLVALVK